MAIRAAVFTLNNPSEGDRALLASPPEYVRYLVYQLEEGEQGTRHFQGYVELSSPKKLAGLKKWLTRAHFEKRYGTREQARDYCMKAEGQIEPPVEHGTFDRGGQGQRNDIKDAVTLLKTTGSMKRVAEEHPSVVVKYARGLQFVENLLCTVPVDPPHIDLVEWQRTLLEILNGEPQRRQIYWVWSHSSTQGKSTFATWCAATFGTDQFMRGSLRMMDTLYLYKRHKIIWFDLPRAINMEIMEALLNQIEQLSDLRDHTSTKYEVVTKVVKAHIVVSCNRPPPRDRLPDRLVEIQASLNPDEEF